MYMYNCIYSQSVSRRRLFSLFSLSNCLNVFVWQNSSVRKNKYESITTITIQFGGSLHTLVLFTYFDVRARLGILDFMLSSDRRTILKWFRWTTWNVRAELLNFQVKRTNTPLQTHEKLEPFQDFQTDTRVLRSCKYRDYIGYKN